MKLVITSQGLALTSLVDPRFGRAKCFLVVNTETDEVQAVDNKANLNASQGAGIQAGRKVIELGADAVITGHVGPKAFATLQAGGVSVVTGATGTAADAVEQFRAGDLDLVDSATVQGHWA
jgi:predicted Fe-Mo cluster-binding NifX family protein